LNDLTTLLFYKIVEIRLVRHRWTGGHSGAIQQVGAHKHRTKLFLPVIQKQKVCQTKIEAFLMHFTLDNKMILKNFQRNMSICKVFINVASKKS
jgi:hypothetical protein